MLETVSHIRVRYAETDRMDVVYHSHYFVWFETARIRLLDQMGIPYSQLESQGYHIPVLAASAEYNLPARFDDRLEIHLRMNEKPRARFNFLYEVRRSGEILATGKTVHAFMSPQGKGLRPPSQFIEKLDAMWLKSTSTQSPG